MSDETETRGQRDAYARETLDRYSARLFGMFTTWLDGYFARNFDGVRILKGAFTDFPRDGALVVFCNHAGWWDPILIMLLAAHMTPGRAAFGPMDEAMLRKYAFMRRLGLYGIDSASIRGAARFLSVSRTILKAPRTGIWMTPQGRFCDVRQRPLGFQAGLAHLARDTDALLVPMAVEYVFWNERKPEALVNFGEPVTGSGGSRERSTEDLEALLEQRLESAMDALALAAMARDPAAFDTLIKGRARVNPLYDSWRYMKALVRREKFSAAHEDERR